VPLRASGQLAEYSDLVQMGGISGPDILVAVMAFAAIR